MITKHAQDIGPDDVFAWLESEPRENEVLEIKQDLSSKKGGRSAWNQGEDRIDDKAKNEIVSEVIAFANAFGGTLVVGIREDTNRKDIAVDVEPIRSCIELAKRFRSICKDLIEPVIPALDIVGVEVNDDGSGVLLFRIPRSRSAPHRSTATKECYVRRSDRADRMSMREIQDLTLQIERGLASIERSFEQRSEAFESFIKLALGNQHFGYALRATALPMSPLKLSETYANDRIRAVTQEHLATFKDDGETRVFFPLSPHHWRPVLRGVSGEAQNGGLYSQWLVQQDGLIETSYAEALSKADTLRHVFHPTWMIGKLADLLLTIERLRFEADQSIIEYGIEIELCVRSNPGIPVSGYGRSPKSLAILKHGRTIFPRYSVQEPESFPALVALAEQDFWNLVGKHYDDPIHVDFSANPE